MTVKPLLAIDRTAVDDHPLRGTAPGDRRSLLLRLEQRLGLAGPEPDRAERAMRYGSVAAGVRGAVFAESLARDFYPTAVELLARRDALRLAGWNGKPVRVRLVDDLARAEVAVAADPCANVVQAGEAERVAAIATALACGQDPGLEAVPIEGTLASWPKTWRPILERLGTRLAAAPTPAGISGASLAAIQTGCGGDIPPLKTDDSFQVLRTRSVQVAAQTVAALLAAEPALLPDTTIVACDPQISGALDFHLARLGLPTSGADVAGLHSPVEGLLPLAIGLCWAPVDPRLLVDLLTLPVGPIPKGVAGGLLAALAELPGLGSATWEEARAAWCTKDKDPEGRTAERLKEWFDHPRVPHGKAAPADLLRSRCSRVAQWAEGRREALDGSEAELAAALDRLAGHSARLGRLFQTTGGELSRPQAFRLLDEVRAHSSACGLPEQAGGPFMARSLAEVPAGCRRLIWLGVEVPDPPHSRWTRGEIEGLQAAGLEVDDTEAAIRLDRSAERRGLARVRERLLVVLSPGAEESRPHPFWSAIEVALAVGGARIESLPVSEDLLAEGGGTVGPWRLPARVREVVAPQPARTSWNAGGKPLPDVEKHSYSELALRLQCPLSWTLKYVLDLEPGRSATLPEVHTLRGTFAHAVLAEVFGNGPLPTPAKAARRAEEVFDQRLKTDAPSLSLPGYEGEAADLRQAVSDSARLLVERLRAAGCTHVTMEMKIDTKVEGLALDGSVDCVGSKGKDPIAVVDIKSGRHGRRRDEMAEGRALQLAIYMKATGAADGGYLIVNRRTLLALRGSPLASGGNQHVEAVAGPAISDAWRRLLGLLAKADDWIRNPRAIPVRPLLDPDSDPEGLADLVHPRLEDRNQDDRPHVCQYCPYGVLCGRDGRD